MKSKLLLLIIFLSIYPVCSQAQNSFEVYPCFPECEGINYDGQVNCFYNQLTAFVENNFKLPQVAIAEEYKGRINVIFTVDEVGEFR